MKTERHLGRELQIEIEDGGRSKKKIATLLCISYNTLIARIEDGKFKTYQIEKLVQKGYLKNIDLEKLFSTIKK